MRTWRYLLLTFLPPLVLATLFAGMLLAVPTTTAAQPGAASFAAATVAVTQTNALTTAAPGSIVTYTVTVTNTGAITANFVRPSDGIIIGSYWLVDTPPQDGASIAGYSEGGTTGSGFSLDPLRPDQVAWVFKLPPAATMAHTVTVRLHPYPCTGAFTNTVRVYSFGAGDGATVDDVDAYAEAACAVYLPAAVKDDKPRP